jgi:hypothetical protein
MTKSHKNQDYAYKNGTKTIDIVKVITIWSAVLLMVPTTVAKPDLRTRTQVGKLTVYSDTDRKLIYYYNPFDLSIGKTNEGRPELLLLLTRYTGTAARGDQGTFTPFSLLSFRVVMPAPSSEDLTEAKKALSSEWRRIKLRPLPIRWLDAAVIYTPVDKTGESPTILPGGDFEPGEQKSPSATRSFWTERYFTMRLGPNDAQLLWKAMHEGQLIMSLGYAFYADGVGPDQPIEELRGSPELVAELKKCLENKKSNEENNKVNAYLVKAGALPIQIDANNWPGLCKKIDINEQIPPDYPVLRIYCFDFNNALNSDLYAKEVEIEATAAADTTGREYDQVRLTAWFNDSEPDLYCHTVRSRFAVRLDKPYRYRIRSIFQDGQMQDSDWQERTVWTNILDITTPRTEEPPEPEPDNSEEGE